MTFKREDRYIVFKRKDLDAAAEEGSVDPSFAEALDTIRAGLPAREFLVIESDWPEYEPAWRMIQTRMDGATPPAAQVQGEREAFEAFVVNFHIGAELDGYIHDDQKYPALLGQWIYDDWDVQSAWATWQARAALSATPAADMTDAYVGAREDLSIWMRRALEAEKQVRVLEQRIDHLVLDAQGETRMGEPYTAPPASEQQQAVVMPEPFMFVKLHAGDVMDWTQDPCLAEYWAEEGDTVAELYSGHDLRLSQHLQPAAPSQGGE